jgi:subtilase family serine protease
VWNDTYNKSANEFTGGSAGPSPLASGGGKSVFFSRPSYQNGVKGVVGNRRGVPDISMSAACNGSVDTYGSYGGAPAGWSPTCGTSEATPLFAGIVALADQVAGHSLGMIDPALYKLSAERAPGIVDVTSGGNTVSFSQGGRTHTVRGFKARRGYDLASGVGTVNALYFVPELARLAG